MVRALVRSQSRLEPKLCGLIDDIFFDYLRCKNSLAGSEESLCVEMGAYDSNRQNRDFRLGLSGVENRMEDFRAFGCELPRSAAELKLLRKLSR
jgi:hypothetical protein